MSVDRMSLEEYKNLKQPKGKNRYGNRKKEDKPTEDGFIFDSNPELYRYRDLKILLKAGEIRDLKVHPVFHLKLKSVNNHGQKISKWDYTVDFTYYDTKDIFHAEDVKSLTIVWKNGKKDEYGTATESSYKFKKNELMRLHPEIKFVETVY